jgi:DNA-directed RNA polymerase specialized sigma24 family protein
MTAKEYLSQLREVKRQQRLLQEEIDELTIKAGYGTGRRIAKNFSGTDRRCRMEDAILNKLELMKELSERLAQQSELENEIMAAIFAVEDKVYQSILLMRYVRCYSWEQIAEEMNYSIRQVYEYHGRALQCVRVPNTRKGGVNI